MTTSELFDLLPDSSLHRRKMVDCQIRTFDVTDPAVIERFLIVPREIFVPAAWKELAYSDTVLEIKADVPNGPTRQLLAPLVLARLLQGASIRPGDKVLDVGSGTGYSSAILAGLASEVTSVESEADFVSLIDKNLQTCELHNVQVTAGRLANGNAQRAPYDVIVINGAVEAQLDILFQQLAENGRLVAIQRYPGDPSSRGSKAIRFEKIAGVISSRVLFDASAVLLDEFQKAPQFVF